MLIICCYFPVNNRRQGYFTKIQVWVQKTAQPFVELVYINEGQFK
jgi:hypothetical protein